MKFVVLLASAASISSVVAYPDIARRVAESRALKARASSPPTVPFPHYGGVPRAPGTVPFIESEQLVSTSGQYAVRAPPTSTLTLTTSSGSLPFPPTSEALAQVSTLPPTTATSPTMVSRRTTPSPTAFSRPTGSETTRPNSSWRRRPSLTVTHWPRYVPYSTIVPFRARPRRLRTRV